MDLRLDLRQTGSTFPSSGPVGRSQVSWWEGASVWLDFTWSRFSIKVPLPFSLFSSQTVIGAATASNRPSFVRLI